MLSAGALNSLFFGVYGVSLRFMTSLRDPSTASKQPSSALTSVKPTNWEIFWAGCAGGAAQLVVACPVDVVKIKLQTQTGENFVKSEHILFSSLRFYVKSFLENLEVQKQSFYAILRALDIIIFENISLIKVHKFTKITIQSL